MAEAREGDPAAAERRIDVLRGIPELVVDAEVESLAAKLIADGGFHSMSALDALHVALAAVHAMDLLLTLNCRHINNADTKPTVRSICALAGCVCPEICTPHELLPGEGDYAP